ncbi:MAG: leucine-rich repeat domain-containing protein, partial [Candidatus Sigynarchaeota archaeon]
TPTPRREPARADTFITSFFLVRHMAKETVEIDISTGMIYTTSIGIGNETRLVFLPAHAPRMTFENVTQIWLIQEELSRVPGWVVAFPNLESFALSGPYMTAITKQDMKILERCKSLRDLGFGGNFPGGIPEEISCLQGLDELTLGASGLTVLPDSLCDLVHLTKLGLSNNDTSAKHPNHFPEFPAVLLRMKGLRELYITGVGMERFPAAKKSELVALERLDISRNPIAELPGWLLPGNAIRRLDLSHTNIAALPGDIGRWTNLEVLDVSFSSLEALPDAIGGCKRLRELRAAGTKLRAVPASIGGCERLEVLDLSGTDVKTLPAELARCDMLKLVRHKHLRPSVVPPAVWHMKGVRFERDDDRMPVHCPIGDKYDYC